MYAIVKTGSAQQILKQGDVVNVPLQAAEPGAVVKFDEVLLLRTDSDLVIGKPLVAGASVEAKVLRHLREPKIMIFKFIKRENYRRKKGHKQPVTEVEITGITTGA